MVAPRLLAQGPYDPLVREYSFIPGPGMQIVWASGSVTISTVEGGSSWNNVTSVNNPITLQAENTYIASGAVSVQFTLPPAAHLGDTFEIIGNGNLWVLGQNAGQTINLGNITTTPGVLGNVTATRVSDCIVVKCIVANTLFTIRDPQGNPELN